MVSRLNSLNNHFAMAASRPASQTNETSQSLMKLFDEIIGERHSSQKAIQEKQMTVYSKFDGSLVKVVIETSCIEGIMPSDFRWFIDNWFDCVQKLSPLIEEVMECEAVDGVKVARTVTAAPWPLSKRIMYMARYPFIDYKKG